MLIYVSGPYRALDKDGDQPALTQAQNIESAAQVAAKLWSMGHAVICPHMNTAGFEERVNVAPEEFIEGDLNMIARCDALVMLPHWDRSEGAKTEFMYAKRLGIPIYDMTDPGPIIDWTVLPDLHPTEVRCPLQAEAFREELGKMYRTHLQKNADYSPANILGTGYVGLITRLWDKMARLMNLSGFRLNVTEATYEAPKDPKNESVEDTLLDLGTYAVIGKLLKDGKWGK